MKFNRNIFYSGIEVKTSDELNQIDLSGNVVIIGSDQVWNPQIAMSDIALLNGVRCKKRYPLHFLLALMLYKVI